MPTDSAHQEIIATTAALRCKTAPELLAGRARATPDEVAYRAKAYGIYHECTWRAYRDRVDRCRQGFLRLGLKPGERVAIMGDPCEEWAIADLAAQAAGAITYGIYPTASPSEVEYQMRDGGAVLFVAENQEYVDKILPLADRLPALRRVIVVDTTAMFTYEHPKLISFARVLRMGEEAGAPDAEAFEAAVGALRPEDPAFIVYTSGTTGAPKGAQVSHGHHLAAVHTFVELYPGLAREDHRTVIYLPLCHVLGRNPAITLPLMTRLVPHFGESLEDLALTLFEVAPTVLLTVPRYLQKFASHILVGIENTTPLKRATYGLALDFGRRYARARWEGRTGTVSTLLYRVLHTLAFRPILNKMGLDKLRLILCGGAPLAPETMALWHIYGVNVVEIYGQTETAGAIITGQDASFPRPGDVGRPPAEWEVALGEQDEVLVRGPDMFDGYWERPEATREVMDGDGWLHTGDVGAWVDGRLRLIDRVRDFIVTSGGKTLSPTAIENALRASPYISEAVVFGDNRKYVTALVEIDYDTVSDWARSRNVAYTGFTSLTRHPEVHGLISAEIARANAELARVEQVKAFRILPKELDPEEEGEPVTPTRKVKRELMYRKFRDLVDSMYTADEEQLIASGVGDILSDTNPQTNAGSRHRRRTNRSARLAPGAVGAQDG